MEGSFLDLDEAKLAATYNVWNEHVIRTAPAARLLVHKATEGFGPLTSSAYRGLWTAAPRSACAQTTRPTRA